LVPGVMPADFAGEGWLIGQGIFFSASLGVLRGELFQLFLSSAIRSAVAKLNLVRYPHEKSKARMEIP